MCSLTSDPPCWVAPPRAETNGAYDFLLVVIWLLESRALVEGDLLILDNAKIHYAASIRDIIDNIFEISGVRMIFLPAYSPELNPCELIFSLVKKNLRHHRGEGRLWSSALDAFRQVSRMDVEQFYKHCLLSVLE